MQKKLLISGLVFSLFASLVSSKTQVNVSAKETANGYQVEEVIRDKFNKETVDSSWELNGASLNHYYNAMHCISPVGYGSGPYINAARLSNKTRYEFTIYPQSVIGGANISFNIGMPNLSSYQSEPNVDCKIQLWDTQVSYVDYLNNLALVQPVTIKNLVPYGLNLYDSTTDVAINVERVNDYTTSVYLELYRDGKQVCSTEGNAFTLLNPRYPNGYSGFFWDCLEMDVTNFKIYNDDELVCQDALENNTITFSSQDPSLGNFHVVGLNETNVYRASINSIKMDSNNASIKNSYNLVEQDNVSSPYELSYNLKINEINNNSFVGFGYGLKDGQKNIDANNAIGFIKLDENNAEVVAVRNGVIDRSNNYQIGLAKLGIGRNQDFTVSFDYAHRAYLTVNGLTFKFDNINFAGQFAIGLVEFDSKKSSDFELNEFRLMANTYKKYASNDLSNDFAGTKLSNDGYSDTPYINTQKYFVGPNVSLEEDWATGKAAITFTGAGAYSAFGVRQKYSEFICEFDIEVLSRQNYQYIGISFGRESVVDVLVTASATSKAFLFRCDNNGSSSEEVLWGSDIAFDTGASSKPAGCNIFDPEHTKYHMMFVAKNRGLYVYYKEADAPITDMGILRAYVPNINVAGFTSIVGTSGASFQVTNYKMVNLSDECVEESELTLREHFDNKNSVSEKLAVDSLSKVNDGRLVMNNSTVSTVNQYLYEMLRFSTYGMDDSMQILFSQGKKLVFDAKNNQIIVNEDGEKTYYDCKDANLKNIKGKRFEITIMGNSLKVGYKGYYDPEDKLSAELFTHTFATSLSKDNISFLANGEVILDDIYLFALDNSMKCASYNYDEDPDDAKIWNVKPDFDASKVYNANKGNKEEKEEKGCNGSASAASMLLILALPLLFRKKKED